jgi:hypothetical protein
MSIFKLTVLSYRLNDLGFKSLHGQQIFSHLQTIQTGSETQPGSYSMGTEALSLGGKASQP